jgi:hypothetical protein
MIIAFAFDKSDNGRVTIHTLRWNDNEQKKEQYLNHPLMRIVPLGSATEQQKEMFYDEEPQLQTRIPTAKKAWGRRRFS